jgi:hypothetical protein
MVMTNKGGNDLRRQGDPGNQDFRARGSALERPVRVECGVCDWENQADCDRLIVTIRLCQWLLTFCPWLTAVPSYWDPTTQQRQRSFTNARDIEPIPHGPRSLEQDF